MANAARSGDLSISYGRPDVANAAGSGDLALYGGPEVANAAGSGDLSLYGGPEVTNAAGSGELPSFGEGDALRADCEFVSAAAKGDDALEGLLEAAADLRADRDAVLAAGAVCAAFETAAEEQQVVFGDDALGGVLEAASALESAVEDAQTDRDIAPIAEIRILKDMCFDVWGKGRRKRPRPPKAVRAAIAMLERSSDATVQELAEAAGLVLQWVTAQIELRGGPPVQSLIDAGVVHGDDCVGQGSG